MRKLLLLDCDGTIRKPLSKSKFIEHPRDQRVIQGAAQAIAYFSYSGYTAVGITNQGGVAAGHKSLDDCIEESLYTLELLPNLEAIYFCPTFKGDCCGLVKQGTYTEYSGQDMRKPGSGMLELARQHYNTSVDDCIYIGDRTEDKQAAIKAGVTFFDAAYWRKNYEVIAKSAMSCSS